MISSCTRCDGIITEQNLESGDAIRHAGKPYCPVCAAKMRLVEAMTCPLCKATDLPTFDGQFYLCRRCGQNIVSKEESEAQTEIDRIIKPRLCPRCGGKIPDGQGRCQACIRMPSVSIRPWWLMASGLLVCSGIAGTYLVINWARQYALILNPAAEGESDLHAREGLQESQIALRERLEGVREQLVSLAAKQDELEDTFNEQRERVMLGASDVTRQLSAIDAEMGTFRVELQHLQESLRGEIVAEIQRAVEAEVHSRELVSRRDLHEDGASRKARERHELDAQTTYWRRKGAADRLRESAELARALAELEQYPSEQFADTEWGAQMQSDREEFLHAIAEAWGRLRGEAEALAQGGDFPRAAERYTEALRVCGTPTLRPEIDRRLAEVQRQATSGRGNVDADAAAERERIAAWVANLGSPDAAERGRSMRELIQAGSAADVLLVGALGSESVLTRRLSAEALGRRRYREAAVVLAESLTKEGDALAAHSMCVSLGQLGDRKVLPTLVLTLEHADRSRAVSALEAIDRIAQESLVASLGPLPEDLRERMEYASRVRERLDLPPTGHPDTPR